MFLEEKLDLILSNQKNLAEKVNLFLPNLEEEKGVMHFLEITKNTFNTYLENGVFVQGIHYIKNGKNRVFIPEEIIKLKQSGIKGKRKSSTKQEQIEAVNLQLGIITKCRSAR